MVLTYITQTLHMSQLHCTRINGLRVVENTGEASSYLEICEHLEFYKITWYANLFSNCLKKITAFTFHGNILSKMPT